MLACAEQTVLAPAPLQPNVKLGSQACVLTPPEPEVEPLTPRPPIVATAVVETAREVFDHAAVPLVAAVLFVVAGAAAPCGRSRVSPTQGERLSTWPRLLAAVSSSRSLQVLNLTGIPLREEQTDELKVAFEASGSLLVLECCHMRLFKSNWQTAFANGGGAGEPTP
mmetsp:Transcript_8995/g.22882  ORF Transcript_8995/g.22882 Transcript_8995/m.22882 type:complete len:167 (+) Transcript_8995:743-1243(+)